ncbi:MAG TPA: glycosyltransferase family 9 protein [Chloroflexota bacterium]|jgi:ADP-heptose:LPS heptosyltransferase
MLTAFAHGPAVDAPSRILLYGFLPIGDALFTLPTIQALRDRYRGAEIVALTHGASAAIFRCVPAIDDVQELPPPAAWRRAGPPVDELRRLRDHRFDVAVDFTSPAYKWISLVCGIPRRLYMKFDPLWWLLPGRHRRWRATHAAAHYYGCARELDLPPWTEVSHSPRLRLPASAHQHARSWLRRGALGHTGPLVALHPGGAWLGGRKRWPAERFAALAEDLERRWDARLLFVGDHQDRGLAARIGAGLRRPPLMAAGDVSLPTSLALIAASDLFIGNDSGPLHAAAALGRPYVAIFGPTVAANFRPLDHAPDQGILVRPAHPCGAPRYFVGSRPVWWRGDCCAHVCAALAAIDVATVTGAADRLLARRHDLEVVG